MFQKPLISSTGENKQNGGSSNPMCDGLYTIPIGQGRSIFCAPSMMGRYLTIRLKGRIESLSLCEVEVYTDDNLGNAINAVKYNFYFTTITPRKEFLRTLLLHSMFTTYNSQLSCGV